MNKLRIGVDLDGVLANFNAAYIDLIKKHTGISLPPVSDTYPNTWHFERAAGVEKSRENAMWKEIKSSDSFWYNLESLKGSEEFLRALQDLLLDADHDLYFVTNRMGFAAKRQAEDWLLYRGVVNPTVLLVKEKGFACKALHLTHYLDDKVENVEQCLEVSPDTKTFLFKAPWNLHGRHLASVESLEEFMSLLKRDAKG